jgi:hypothetical protein
MDRFGVISGCSGGGIGVAERADFIRATLPPLAGR